MSPAATSASSPHQSNAKGSLEGLFHASSVAACVRIDDPARVSELQLDGNGHDSGDAVG
jgi:hypothetical protein